MDLKTDTLLKIGSVVLFLSLTTLLSYLLTKIYLSPKNFSDSQSLYSKEISPTPHSVWDEYKDEEFKFSISHPRFLYKKEFKDAGGYVKFIRFEETDFSREKGLALGIRKAKQEDEVSRIKGEFLNDPNARLVKETNILVAGVMGRRLDFEPLDPSSGEKKSVVIFSRGDLVYSLSTVPEQIVRLVNSFKFL